ncbi:MAG: hypothetical protein Q4E76_04320 [Tissierellia bacterium]|nr:hypothetical protein [Tissierellia bacterium]
MTENLLQLYTNGFGPKARVFAFGLARPGGILTGWEDPQDPLEDYLRPLEEALEKLEGPIWGYNDAFALKKARPLLGDVQTRDIYRALKKITGADPLPSYALRAFTREEPTSHRELYKIWREAPEELGPAIEKNLRAHGDAHRALLQYREAMSAPGFEVSETARRGQLLTLSGHYTMNLPYFYDDGSFQLEAREGNFQLSLRGEELPYRPGEPIFVVENSLAVEDRPPMAMPESFLLLEEEGKLRWELIGRILRALVAHLG